MELSRIACPIPFDRRTIRTISEVFWNVLADSNSIFVVTDFFFLNDSIFWCVQSSITHSEAVRVHVLWACLHPHNSISNVVVSVTIHDDINMCMYIQTYV